MIRIVTIEREYGCGGGEIAQLLAKELGWKVWDQLLTEEIARLARQHNNANVLAIGARTTPEDEIPKIVRAWFETAFEGGRHAARVAKISEVERSR